ncbi:MAG: alginate lyase family protein [Candidatus Zixiibacteriota bacterium]
MSTPSVHNGSTDRESPVQRWRRPASRLPSRLILRLRREIAPILPVRGRLPKSWISRMAPAIGARTWRDHFALDRGPGWYWNRREQGEIREWIVNHAPRMIGPITRRADRVCDGTIPILGHGEIAWTPKDGWSRDPVTGIEFPRTRAERVPIVLPDNKSDIKHVWEPGRFHYAPTLAVAWHLTGDVRYAEVFRDYVSDFCRENPCGYGPQWTNPMEIAIRACNWIVAWQWCREAPAFDEAFVRTFIGSLIEHGRVIARNLERTRRGLNTNHYIADLVGLYAIAAFIPEWKEAGKWQHFAWRELLAESSQQVLPDGFCYESSFAYHRLTFEMWHFAWRLGSRREERDAGVLLDVLNRMAAFSLANAGAGGCLPQFGDGDDGRFVFWEARSPEDHSHIIQLATALPGLGAQQRDHHIIADPAEDVLWLAGAESYHDAWRRAGRAMGIDGSRTPGSRAFPDAQVAALRSDRWFIHAFANPVGTGGIGGHKHNDLLSFVASFEGNPVVIDPGTGAYTADPKARNRFRRTSAHATVEIDGLEQNRFVGAQLFCLWKDATPRILEFEDAGETVRVVMRHDGYARLADPVIHERTLMLDRREESIAIKDRLEGHGTHTVVVTFPLGSVAIAAGDDTSAKLKLPDGDTLEVTLSSDQSLRMSTSLGWRSRSYGTREGHRRLLFSGTVQAPCCWEIVIRPETVERSTLGAIPNAVANSSWTPATQYEPDSEEVAHA